MKESATLAPLATELRTVVTRLIKKLREHSPARDKLSLTERSVVLLLERHPALLPSELAALEKVTAQAMSQLVSRLTDLGYVSRQPVATDKRKVLVALTAAGRALLQTVRHERDEWLHQALAATCSAAELASLRAALPVLARLVEAP